MDSHLEDLPYFGYHQPLILFSLPPHSIDSIIPASFKQTQSEEPMSDLT